MKVEENYSQFKIDLETNVKMVVKSAIKQQSRVSEIFFKKSVEIFLDTASLL